MAARRESRGNDGRMTGRTDDLTERVRGTFAALKQQTGEQAGQVFEQLREQGTEYVSRRKALAAEGLSSVGAAIHRAAEKLTDQNSSGLATYVDAAAQRVDEAAKYVEQRDLAELRRDAESFVRRQPAVALGAMFIGGLALAQFIKAASDGGSSRSRR
jgi:hypothetical protein